MTPTLGYIAFFLAFGFGTWALYGRIAERRGIQRSLRGVRAIEIEGADLRRRELAIPLVSRVIVPGFKRVGTFAHRVTPAASIDRLAKLLAYAGGPAGWDAERVLATKVVFGGSFLSATFLLSPALEISALRLPLLAVLMGALGYYIPDVILRSRAQARQEAIRRALPDSLDLLSITVEAGLGFDAAIQRVSREIGGPLGQELHRVVQEMQLGRARTDTFRDLAERSEVEELRSFVVSMVQADVFGLSVANALAVQAREMRIKRRQRAEERAHKIPVKIVLPLMFCIFPALFVVIIGPAAIRISQSFTM
jgi:tight adherence protein C